MKKYLAPLVAALLITVGASSFAYAQDLPATVAALPFIGDVFTKFSPYIPLVLQVVGFFSMLAALTKNETDDKVIGYILKGINMLGFNIGAAKNDPMVK